MAIASINPATGECLRRFDPYSRTEIETRLERASSAFRCFRTTSFSRRADGLLRLASLLDARQEALARTITLEMGKPIREARAEVAKCALACRYYAQNGQRALAPETVPTSARLSSVRYDPLGIVLAVMPWNFPLWQVFRFAAPAVMAGNVALLKHASNVPQCALAIEQLFLEAGFEPGVFQTLLVGSDVIPDLLADRRVVAATLTGSDAAGRSVARYAGQHIKKTVLELGGSDPFIVMPSARLEAAVETAVRARCINSGQSCIAAKRFIIHRDLYPTFERHFTARMSALRVGDPLDETTDIGPLATAEIRETLLGQLRAMQQAGARLLLGGGALDRPGFFVQPAVLAQLPRTAPVYRQEVFGPAAALFEAASLEQALEIANDTPFGLGASVWTEDQAEQECFARDLESGQVFFNAMVASDPHLPFGGIKDSGYGRELGFHGIREFVNIKTIWIA